MGSDLEGIAAMTSPNALFALADRFMRAAEGDDEDAVLRCYAPDARIWHNNDQKAQGPEENVKVLRWVWDRLKQRRYEIVSRQAFPGGYVQQHILTGVLTDGTPFRMPACLVVTVENERIARLDEYIDSAQIAPLLKL